MDLSDTVHWLHSTVQSQSGNLFSLGYSHCQSLIKAAYCSVCALCVKHRCQGCSRLVFDFMCVFTCLKKEERQKNTEGWKWFACSSSHAFSERITDESGSIKWKPSHPIKICALPERFFSPPETQKKNHHKRNEENVFVKIEKSDIEITYSN